MPRDDGDDPLGGGVDVGGGMYVEPAPPPRPDDDDSHRKNNLGHYLHPRKKGRKKMMRKR